jgi:hypothetical protein
MMNNLARLAIAVGLWTVAGGFLEKAQAEKQPDASFHYHYVYSIRQYLQGTIFSIPSNLMIKSGFMERHTRALT